MRHIHKRNRGDIPQHNTKCRPHLPHHNQSTADISRGALGAIHRGGCGFGAHRKPEEKTAEQQIPPGMRGRHPERGGEGDETGDKDASAATKPAVQGRCSPASDDGRAEIRGAVEEALEPSVGDIKFRKVEPALLSIAQMGKEEYVLLCSVDGSLIHSLYDSGSSTED